MTTVVAHGNCMDGWTAAWVARKKLGTKGVRYLFANYGNPPPPLEDDDRVYVLDFSYPRAILEDMASEVPTVVLDHHRTAEQDLKGLPFCTFDMNHSGAMLAWRHFFPGEEPPALVRYVEDRDLWRFALPHSREVSGWLWSWFYPTTEETWTVWDEVAALLDGGPLTRERAINEGTAILRMRNAFVAQMVEHAIWRELTDGTEVYRVPVVNASILFSEVPEALCKKYPEAPFAAYYFDRGDGKTQWGLRSRGGFDVSRVAKFYGGGGHAAAAGFTFEGSIGR